MQSQSAVVISQMHEGRWRNSACETKKSLSVLSAARVGSYNTLRNGSMAIHNASLVFNSIQSVFHGLRCSWQDHFTLQVGKVAEKYQLKESLSFREGFK